MDKKKRKKKTVLISPIVLLGIWFPYFGGGTLAGLGIFRAILDHRLSDKKTLNHDKYCLQKTQKVFSNFAQMEVVNVKNYWQELKG